MKALLLSVLLFCSCTKQSPLTKDAMGMRISDVQMPITGLNEIEWAVGKKKEVNVTQSITFVVDLPKVSEDDLEHLSTLKGIDAWIIRLIVNRGSERQDLGSLYARFKPKSVMRGQSTSSPTSVALKIYFAAAYASERFRFFNCPAFDHSQKIKNMNIKGENSSFELAIGQISPYPEKSHLIELTPSAFNGGNSLVGEYFIEIAPYDSVNKVIHAPFKRIPNYVEVSSETKELVKSCSGEHPEIKK